MEGLWGSGLSGVSAVVKKKRSAASRRPQPDLQLVLGSHNLALPLSTPSSDNSNKLSPDESEFFLNNSAPRGTSADKSEVTAASEKIKKDYKEFGNFYGFSGNGGSRNSEKGRSGSGFRCCSEGVLPSANWKSSSKGKQSGKGHSMHQVVGAPDVSAENKLRKVRLKVGGLTRTIHAKSNLETDSSNSSARSSDSSWHRQVQDNSDDNHSSPGKANDLQGYLQKDFSGASFSCGAKEVSQNKVTEVNLPASFKPVRKSKRVPKRRVLDDTSDDVEKDDEIRYLERLKTSATDYTAEYEEDRDDSVNKRKLSKVSKSRNTAYDVDEDYGLSRSTKESRKSSRKGSIDMDYVQEEESVSDAGPKANRKKQKRVPVDSYTDVRAEPLITTRQRALQSSKDGIGSSLIEFPNGLPPAPPRRQKEKLSEEEQQAKKAEAAQRRKMQVEKAARESEALAIRKILGLDSDKKKAEKERARAEKAKAAKSQTLASNTVRLIMGPNGTVVIFPKDADLQTIFNSKPCSYPPPREKCAGPSCTNAYKYRDSKSNLPLCSLQCYRAVQGSQSIAC